ncbi:MAG TPA: CvpA family protein, partial [Lachnospiraceae bacterium]|nr:CvpA family protein [Lachnospiraceae bacterium]
MNWLVFVVIAIIVAFALKGRNDGFIKTIFSIFSIVVAIVVASVFSPYVSKTLRSNEKFYNYINEKVADVIHLEDKEDETVSEQVDAIDRLSLPESIKKSLVENKNNSEVYKALHVDDFNEYVVGYVSTLVINAIAFIGTLVVANIALFLLANALNIISKLPIINGLNKTAGLLVGIFKGLLVIWMLCILLTATSSTNSGQYLFKLVE